MSNESLETIVKKGTIGYFYFLWTTWDFVWSLGTPWTFLDMFPRLALTLVASLGPRSRQV
jgi:hypothetical protein